MGELLEKLTSLENRVETATKSIGTKSVATKRTPKASDVFGLPSARRGEDAMSSRGFQFVNMIKALTANSKLADPWENAKVEKAVAQKLQGAYGKGIGAVNFGENGGVLCPFGTDLLHPDVVGPEVLHEMKSLMYAGVEGADPDEIRWMARKSYQGGQKDLSWLDQTAGGALVGPPQMGELIELYRNKDALIRAGATVVPLPPTGRMQWPRQTSSSTGYWVGENRSTTASNIGTGLLTLSAKQCAAIITMPNALIRFAGPAAEALVRNDIVKTLSLTFDLASLEGAGGDLKPTGIINTSGISTVTPTTAASGNTGALLAEGDIYSFLMKVAEANAEFGSFIMAPSMYYALLKRRNDAVTANDAKGAFSFSPFRNLGDRMDNMNINGFPVTVTNQVSTSRTQGSAANLTYILGGAISEVMIALFGGIEFAAATQGDTVFANDQVSIRGIMIGDSGVKHPAAIAFCDKLQRA